MEKEIFSNIPEKDSVFFEVFDENITKTAGIKDYLKGFINSNGVSSEIDGFLNSKEFKPDKENKGYLVMSAMGAAEAWGSNMNCDSFDESELKQSYKTFEKGYAYEEHENKDPRKSVGRILFSCYNDKMRRVELVVEVNDKKGKGEKFLKKLWQVSMGTTIQYDECPVCGNKAKTKKDYCEHIKKDLGKIMPNGIKVVMKNVGCKFFDISFVTVAADLVGRTLRKIASKQETKEAEITKNVESNVSPNVIKIEDAIKKVYDGKKLPKEYKKVEDKIKEGKLQEASFILEKMAESLTH